ncbi:MAG: hypothetical protein RBJ76_17030 [Stenomitos frigidus ULC029]
MWSNLTVSATLRKRSSVEPGYAVTVKTSNVKNKLILFATGLVVLAAGSAVGYWHHSQREWCVQFTAGGGQEVTYSRGCLNRQRYKKWTLTASRIDS